MKKVNLDITHRCTLKCPRCLRQYYHNNSLKVPGQDITFDEYKKIISFFKYINFCGNISDPVFNPNFIDFLKLNYKLNIKCEISTAATGKSLKWYKEAFLSNPDAKWIFGLDGYPEDSNQYRINQDGEILFETMKMCSNMGLNTYWRMIVFKYNENDIEECKKLANHYNINFELIKSSRFTKNDSLKPTTHYIKRNYEKDISKMSI